MICSHELSCIMPPARLQHKQPKASSFIALLAGSESMNNTSSSICKTLVNRKRNKYTNWGEELWWTMMNYTALLHELYRLGNAWKHGSSTTEGLQKNIARIRTRCLTMIIGSENMCFEVRQAVGQPKVQLFNQCSHKQLQNRAVCSVGSRNDWRSIEHMQDIASLASKWDGSGWCPESYVKHSRRKCTMETIKHSCKENEEHRSLDAKTITKLRTLLQLWLPCCRPLAVGFRILFLFWVAFSLGQSNPNHSSVSWILQNCQVQICVALHLVHKPQLTRNMYISWFCILKLSN